MTAASIVLLVVACGILFAVAWNSMMTVSQLRNENRTLALMVNACSTRLENEGIAPLPVPQAAPAPAAQSAEPKPAEAVKPQVAEPKPEETAKPQPEKAEAAPAAAEQKKEESAAPAAQNGSVVVEGVSVPLPPEKETKK